MDNYFKGFTAISMTDFFMNYLDIDNIHPDILKKLDRINHYDITDLNIKGIKRVPNQVVSVDDLKTGRIILVKASGFKHKKTMICAYVRPDLVLYDENNKDNSELDKMIMSSLYKKDLPLVKRSLTKKK